MSFQELLITFVAYLFQLLSAAIFIRALLSWFPISRDNPLVMFLDRVTEPILAPLRRVIPPIGGVMDITPIVAILLLQFLSQILFDALR
ncbi:MAG: YggT family protein [Chloroflexota bacterium]